MNDDKIVTVLNKDERFAIYWCFNRAMDYVDKHIAETVFDPNLDIIVGKTNITQTIKNMLNRLVV